MGYTLYNSQERAVRADTLGYKTKYVDDIFEQNKIGQIHESMRPSKALLRESRDSDTHPNSVPIIIGLDETGSMGRIPHQLVKEGLPHMMETIMERGIPDPQILFVAVGDHKTDQYPFQVGQFESGDKELDMWLTRTYLEGRGGGNGGESYFLPWYFAGHHTETDAWEKRQEKGFLFTIGDEKCHDTFPSNCVEEIFGHNPERSFSSFELLEKAKEKWDVYHIHILEGFQGERTLHFWKELLGENCISVKNSNDVAKIIAEIIAKKPNKTILSDESSNIIEETDKVKNENNIKNQKINL